MELRLAIRNLRRRPLVSLAVVFGVALSIAVNAALFSVLDGLVYRPLPLRDADRLVQVDYDRSGPHFPDLLLPEMASRREEICERLLHSALIVGASQAVFAPFFNRADEEEFGIHAYSVDSAFFPLLGLSPVVGSGFSDSDELNAPSLPGNDPTLLPVIISHGMWKGRYGGDRNITGIRELAGRRVRVVGVMGPGVKFPGETNVWVPAFAKRDRPPKYIRLAGESTIAQLSAAFPDLLFTPLRQTSRPGTLGGLPLLLAAALMLLIVTWVQVTALTFVGSTRQLHDTGVCLSLGAGRRRILFQAAIENAVIAVGACGLAWLLTRPLTAFVVRMLPTALSRGQYLDPDWRTLTFICMMSLLGFALLTTIPFIAGREGRLLSLLNGRITNRSLSMQQLRQSLLVGQVTVTVVLLYLAGLAVHSFARAATFDYGFDADHVVVFTPPAWAPNETTVSVSAFEAHNQRLLSTLEHLKGTRAARAAALIGSAPFGIGEQYEVSPITSFNDVRRTDVSARVEYVGVHFVSAFGATLVAGRSFDDPEYQNRDDVVVVNEALANLLSPPIRIAGRPALAPPVIGRQFQWERLTLSIIGVVKDLWDGPTLAPVPQFFRAERRAGRFLVIRSNGSTDSTLPELRTALARDWGPLRAGQLVPMREKLSHILIPLRSESILLGLIAICCVPIAWIGVLGAVTYSVRLRRSEIAIRMAMGADPVRIRRDVTVRALAAVAVGVLLGVGLGVIAQSVIGHVFFQVRAADVLTVAVVTACMGLLSWIAADLPARQAARIDPAVVLREG